MGIVDPILWHCRRRSDAPAIIMPGKRHHITSYGELGRMIANVASRASSLGLQRGDVVGVAVENHAAHAALVLGLMHLGIATVSSTASFPNDLGIAAVVGDFSAAPPPAGARLLPFDFSWTMGAGTLATELGPQADQICRIVLTSGTTGDSKAVAFTHRMVAARILRFDHSLGTEFPQLTRHYLGFGFGTALGFLFLIYTLTRGGALCFVGDTHPNTINAWELHGIESWLGSPAGLAKFVDLLEASARRPALRFVFSGGSLLAPSLARRVRQHMCANVVAGYGATETHMVAAAPAAAIESVDGAVGYLLPGTIVEAVDESGVPLPRGSQGRLRIRGDYVVDGYHGEPATDAFRDGWFYPGDIGALGADEMLIISGREKFVINAGGNKINPERIEAVLLAHDAITQAGVLGVPNADGIEEPWAVVVIARDDLTESDVQEHCRARLAPDLIPRRILFEATLPRGAMSKIDRRRLSELLKRQAGTLQPGP